MKLHHKGHSVWLTIRNLDDDDEYPKHSHDATHLYNVKRNGLSVSCNIISEAGKVSVSQS